MNFKEAFPESASGPNDAKWTTVGGQKVSQGQAQNEHLYRERVLTVLRRGVIPATVINLHSFPVKLNMGFLGIIEAPGKKTGTPFHKHVITDFRIDRRDNGENRMTPEEVLPIELARDLVREYEDTGGVFCYEGSGNPPEELLNEHIEKQLVWHWKLFNEAEADWSTSKNNPRYITDRQREAARELFSKGLLSKQPAWLTVSKQESLETICGACGVEVRKSAKFCTQCKYMFDPAWCKENMPHIYREQRPDEFEDEDYAEVAATGQPAIGQPVSSSFGKAGQRVSPEARGRSTRQGRTNDEPK